MKAPTSRRHRRPWTVAAMALAAAALATTTVIAPISHGGMRAVASAVPVGAVSITLMKTSSFSLGRSSGTSFEGSACFRTFPDSPSPGMTIWNRRVPPGTCWAGRFHLAILRSRPGAKKRAAW